MDEKQIFNFVSNSYSQFLSHYPRPALSDKEFYSNSDLSFNQPFNLYRQIYLTQKRQAKLHQLIFFGFSLLFFALGEIVYFNTTNWACSIYFNNCAFIKSATYSFCFVLAFITFFIGYFAKPEKDTVYYLFSKMEKKLKDLYRCRKKELGFILSFQLENRMRKMIFHQTYLQARDCMREHKDQTLHVLDKITKSSEHNVHAKEMLINQTLSELQNTLNGILQSYKQQSYVLAIKTINEMGCV